MIELAIRNGLVVDGTGAGPRTGDVGVDDGRIVAVGTAPEAEREIDAAGKVIAPGFIDIHSHSDFTLLVDPRASSAVHQGVTTEVVGNCGFGCFPLLNKELAPKAIYGHSSEVPLTWTSASEYFERLEEAQPAINVASLAPNGQIRLSVVGLADRPARPDELARMRYLLDEALEQGAYGYSTGLEYAAERGASEDELVSMCEVCGRRHGLYATHTRRRDEGADEAVAEALRTAERSGARLQVSHLVPRNGIESSRRCVDLVDAAAAAGMDVAFDMHTRLYGTTFLLSALPPSALEDPGSLREILGSPERRRQLRSYESILSAGGDWSRIVLLDNDFWPQYARRDIASIAADRGQDALDAVYDLLLGAAADPGEADGADPRLHRGAAARGVRPPALRAGIRCDHHGAGRPTRGRGLPRRVHVGGVVSPLLRAGAARALAGGSRPPVDGRPRGAARPPRPGRRAGRRPCGPRDLRST